MARGPVILWREAIRDSKTLSPNARLIAYTLSTRMHADGTNAFPSLDRMATEAHRCRKTVIAGITELETAGYLEVTRGCGRGHSNRYAIAYPVGITFEEPCSSSHETVEESAWNCYSEAA